MKTNTIIYKNLKVGDVIDFETQEYKNPKRGFKKVASAIVVELYSRVALCRTEFGYMICVSRIRPHTYEEAESIGRQNELYIAMNKKNR